MTDTTISGNSTDNISTETVQSGLGNDFEVSRMSTDQEASANSDAVKGKPPFGITVNWPANGQWNILNQADRAASGIIRAKVEIIDGSIYTYKLTFENEIHYDYEFFDGTGDGYSVNTWTDSTHTMSYNSSKPTIVLVRGD